MNEGVFYDENYVFCIVSRFLIDERNICDLVSLYGMWVFAANIVKKAKSLSTPSLLLASVLCVMQLFPMIGAFFVYTSYALNGFYHVIVFIIGIPNIKQLLIPQIEFRER